MHLYTMEPNSSVECRRSGAQLASLIHTYRRFYTALPPSWIPVRSIDYINRPFYNRPSTFFLFFFLSSFTIDRHFIIYNIYRYKWLAMAHFRYEILPCLWRGITILFTITITIPGTIKIGAVMARWNRRYVEAFYVGWNV